MAQAIPKIVQILSLKTSKPLEKGNKGDRPCHRRMFFPVVES
ncbi:hypothetical protein NON20_10365 [Synechocystis sp. B12]|nr:MULTISPECIES: hypothetical protein [unclassified Synechocystis]WLT39775.1 hypothetical protein NON20_10365 [Synechocystis sp. B12]